MTESYSVRVAKADHVFCAAHFVTVAGKCERLHGHNYHVAVEVGGPLDDDHLVVDFLAVRDALVALCGELDHFVLLPTESSQILLSETDDEVTATYGQRRWTFPRGDCRLLPVANTTAELLAAYLGRRLLALLAPPRGGPGYRLRVELDECDGQVGVWELASRGEA